MTNNEKDEAYGRLYHDCMMLKGDKQVLTKKVGEWKERALKAEAGIRELVDALDKALGWDGHPDTGKFLEEVLAKHKEDTE